MLLKMRSAIELVWIPSLRVEGATYQLDNARFLLLHVRWFAKANCSFWMKVSTPLSHSNVLSFDSVRITATSAIDYKTDGVIQSSLRHGLKGGISVITIAHRLQTIMDCDKIMVLDAGRMVSKFLFLTESNTHEFSG